MPYEDRGPRDMTVALHYLQPLDYQYLHGEWVRLTERVRVWMKEVSQEGNWPHAQHTHMAEQSGYTGRYPSR